MKLLFDLFPILLFFATFKLGESNQQVAFDLANALVGGLMSGEGMRPDQGPIILATSVAIVASICQVSYLKLRGKTVDIMLWVSFFVITVFGGLTIYFHNDTFIKWKPTIIFWLQAAAFTGAHLFFKKNLLRQVMESQFKLPDPVWDKLLKAWILAFLFIGGVNLLAAFVFYKDDTSGWVSFKTFALQGMLFAFIIAQTFYLSKYLEEETEEKV
jgi:intracellular septation protein